jgi:hypothetical protein
MRLLSAMVLLCILLALPFVAVSPVTMSSGHVLTTLDVCSLQAQGSTGDITTLAEPAYDVQTVSPVAYLPTKKVLILDLSFFSPIDRPPVA